MKITSNLSAIQNAGASQSVAANNVANVNSDAFKSRAMTQYGLQNLVARTDGGQGSLVFRGTELSVAVNGRGYLPVQLPNGETGYSRSVALSVDKKGSLTDNKGNPVLPNINLPVPVSGVSVDSQGMVSALDASGQRQDVGQLQLAVFPNPEGLQQAGDGVQLASQASGEPMLNTPGNGEAGSLAFGATEQSNVNPGNEMVTMIVNQTTMAYNVKAMQVQEQMFQSTLNIKA